jgi:hypothetical protein
VATTVLAKLHGLSISTPQQQLKHQQKLLLKFLP